MKSDRDSGSRFNAVVAAAIGGVGIAYFFDPRSGTRRRALLRDFAVHESRRFSDLVQKAGRDMAHRVQGLAHDAVELFHKQEHVPDDLLLERVRSRIGRSVSHPRAIDVEVNDGTVVLAGHVLESEVDQLLRDTERVKGVRGIENRLETHREPGTISSLQGGRPRMGTKLDILQDIWSPATRFVVASTGAGMILSGLRRTRTQRSAFVLPGSLLLLRAAINRPFRQMLGAEKRRGIDVQKTLEVNAPPEQVYALWSDPENFPRFMEHVLHVKRTIDGGYRWTVAGPAGMPVTFMARITEKVPNRSVAWQSEEGSIVDTAGAVRFEESGEGSTRLTVRMRYNPPAGVLGHGVAWIFGKDPRHAMIDDLARFKSLLELGRTRAHHQRVYREQLDRGEIPEAG